MMLKLISSFVLFVSMAAQASQTFKINLDTRTVSTSKVSEARMNFTKFEISGFDLERTVGAPELPVKSWVVVGTPETIKTSLVARATKSLNGKPFPVQEQDCRCVTSKVKSFEYNEDLYSDSMSPVTVTYLGSFRGQPLSKVDLKLAKYNSDRDQVDFITDGSFEISASDFVLPKTEMKDFLIVVPAQLAESVTDFVAWKQSKGFNMMVAEVSAPNNSLKAIQKLIQDSFKNNGTDFVMIIGDENMIPMFRVKTSGSSQTPSDLQYFTMEGASDYVPDMFASRIVGKTIEQVKAQLAKSMEFEQGAYVNNSGMNKFIGIASNEGSNPSDNEYVLAIGDKYKEVLKSEILHLFQNDSTNSTPATLNRNFDSGASWLTYLGHGSGTSWPSMYQQYTTSDIKKINNKPAVKPIIIDVACQNGRLIESNLGASFMRAESMTSNSPFGAVAYYGGSVDISWHPPAVMAQGIAFEHLANKYNHLGEALLAGQLYLAKKWSNKEQVIDNMEWYHLQGDPSLNIKF